MNDDEYRKFISSYDLAGNHYNRGNINITLSILSDLAAEEFSPAYAFLGVVTSAQPRQVII